MHERIFLALTYVVIFGIVLYVQTRLYKISRRNIFLSVRIPKDKLKDQNLIEIYNKYKQTNYITGGIALQ